MEITGTCISGKVAGSTLQSFGKDGVVFLVGVNGATARVFCTAYNHRRFPWARVSPPRRIDTRFVSCIMLMLIPTAILITPPDNTDADTATRFGESGKVGKREKMGNSEHVFFLSRAIARPDGFGACIRSSSSPVAPYSAALFLSPSVWDVLVSNNGHVGWISWV